MRAPTETVAEVCPLCELVPDEGPEHPVAVVRY